VNALSGKRILVVGASSGIGRAIAEQALASGARVAGLARRREGAVTHACDVRDPLSVASSVASAIDSIGGIDALIYAAGVVPLATLDSAELETFRSAFETNAVGAALVARAALAALAESHGQGLFLSSDGVGAPREGLAIYTASKAALEELVLGWRREHPEVRWTTVIVGPTATAIASAWDRKLTAKLWPRWQAEGHDRETPAQPDDVARRVLALLETDDDVPRRSTHEPRR